MLSTVLDLLIPAVCPLCRAVDGATLCPACTDGLLAIESPCPWCAAPHGGAGLCPACSDVGLRHIDAIHVRWHYHGSIDGLVTMAKALGRPAAVHACTELVEVNLQADVVTAIPETRGRRHGPHLATAIARRVARRNGLPFKRLLRHTRRPAAQHALSQSERQRNVAGLFLAAPCPAHVVLVDDLLTSGATLESAARALRSSGARQVTAVCLARTPTSGDLPGETP